MLNVMCNEVPLYAYFITFFSFIIIQIVPFKWLERKPFNCELCFSFWCSLIGMFILFSVDFLLINFFVSFISLKLVNDKGGYI